jgi:hypothetical protein
VRREADADAVIEVGLTPSYRDFACWQAAQFLRRGLGLYLDNVCLKPSADPLTSAAYPLPDGTIQPAAGIWALREYLQRLWVLHHEIDNLKVLLRGLHARMRGLESTWRDQEHRKFAEAFEQTMKVLAAFLEASRDHVSFLGKKASHAEEYLKQR